MLAILVERRARLSLDSSYVDYHVVRVHRNRTEGRQVRDVALVTRRGFPRSRDFEDVEFPLEHRSSKTKALSIGRNHNRTFWENHTFPATQITPKYPTSSIGKNN